MTDPREPERHDPEGSEPSPPKPGRPAGGARRRGAPGRRAPRRAAERFSKGRISAGDILGSTFSMYFRNFVPFTGIAVLVFLPAIVLRIWAYRETPQLAFRVLDFVLTQIVAAAIIYGVFRQVKKKTADMGRCLSIAVSRFLPLLGVVLLTIFACFTPVIPGLLALLIHPVLGVLVALVGVVFFVMIYVSLFVAPAVVVVERTGVQAALRRSLNLTRGNRWRVFFVYFLIGLLAGLLDNIWTVATAPSWFLDSTVPPPLVTALGSLVIALVFGAIHAVALALIYYNLKVKVEGIDEDELASIFD